MNIAKLADQRNNALAQVARLKKENERLYGDVNELLAELGRWQVFGRRVAKHVLAK